MRYLFLLLTVFVFSCDVPDGATVEKLDIRVTLSCDPDFDWGESANFYYDYGTGYIPSVLYKSDTLDVTFAALSGTNLNLWINDETGTTKTYTMTVYYAGITDVTNITLNYGGVTGDYYKTIILP